MSRVIDTPLLELAQKVEARTAFLFTVEIAEIPNTWRYTTLSQEVVIGGNTYTPATISLNEGGESIKGGVKPDPFSLNVGALEPFLSFTSRRFPHQIRITVYECYFAVDGTPHAMIIADGFCSKVEHVLGGATVEVMPYSKWLNRRIPSMLYSRSDQRVPYGEDFDVNPASFQDGGEVVSVSANSVVCTLAGTRPAGYWANGVLEYTRVIGGLSVLYSVPILNNLFAVGDNPAAFITSYAPPGLMAGDSIVVRAGYNGSPEQSIVKFANWTNFRGFPDMPTQNPATTMASPCPDSKCSCQCSATDVLCLAINGWSDTRFGNPSGKANAQAARNADATAFQFLSAPEWDNHLTSYAGCSEGQWTCGAARIVTGSTSVEIASGKLRYRMKPSPTGAICLFSLEIYVSTIAGPNVLLWSGDKADGENCTNGGTLATPVGAYARCEGSCGGVDLSPVLNILPLSPEPCEFTCLDDRTIEE